MRVLPRSLAGRLLVTAALALLAALAFAAVAIGAVLERFVTQQLDERLDTQIQLVKRAVAPDGTLDRARLVDLPPFSRSGSGWVWQVRAPGGVLRSGSMGAQPLVMLEPPRAPRGHDDRLQPFEAHDADGRRLHGRRMIVPTSRGDAEVIAAAPRWIVERPLRAATRPLLLSLALLGVALAVAVLVQLHVGLRPVRRMAAMLADVRDGRRRHIEVAEPTELLPLVIELNALIDANQAALARARGHLANLAHGLKTPLAALRIDLAAPDNDPDGRLSAAVARLEGQVRHHLGRASAAQPGAASRAPVPVHDHITDLVAALSRLHADRGVVATVDVRPELTIRCDPRDLDELLGNLLDNGWRHARSRVQVTGIRDGRTALITIADDGPGMAPDRLAHFAAAGRADQQADGHGLGLGIARELIELNGGTLKLGAGALGGLNAEIRLPAGLD